MGSPQKYAVEIISSVINPVLDEGQIDTPKIA